MISNRHTKRQRRTAASEDAALRQCLLAGFIGLDAWRQLELAEAEGISRLKRWRPASLARELDDIGPWAKLISGPLMQPLLQRFFHIK